MKYVTFLVAECKNLIQLHWLTVADRKRGEICHDFETRADSSKDQDMKKLAKNGQLRTFRKK